MRENKRLYIVIPCYNEQEVLPETAKRLKEKCESMIQSGKISADSRVLFVNDGSKDTTWDLICQLHESDELFSGLTLSRNRGHQCALLSGLMYAKDHCDISVSIDADLQDDINAIEEMVDKYHAGCEIVYGVRNDRQTDSFFKRFTAEGFYRILNFFGAQTVFNHADFRLMSKVALEGLEKFDEVNLFLRGIVHLIGYQSDVVYYKRSARFAGESKYPLKKMLMLAVDGITSFSVKPIRMITGLGFFVFFVSIIMGIYTLASLFSGDVVAGWSSTLISIWALGGLTLLALGIVGEYVGKIYMEVKNRPKFIVKQVLDKKDEE